MYLISDGGMNTNILDTIESVMLTKNIKDIDGIKLDVRKSLDGVFVIARDEDLEKFSYGQGKVNEYHYSYLRKIKFPSHVFKYYIPTLEEILKGYNKEKIIVLELYDLLDLDKLFIILIKYPYKYYFFSKQDMILNKLKELDFDKIGNIINDNNIINSITNHDIYTNTFLIKD